MPSLKFALIGCGALGKVHTRCLTQVPDAEFVAYADVSRTAAQDCLEEFGGDYATSILGISKLTRVGKSKRWTKGASASAKVLLQSHCVANARNENNDEEFTHIQFSTAEKVKSLMAEFFVRW